ncbi:serine/threonine-protein kinase VRK1-like [Coccinella septempunctata]|uniref:serine/threonine-protein kinase VRK1-like n=1 Tax=Coccinella septempunctata TaxID=41139 RepID=UPI001D067918|nr:serine/threonine-protein kinase VRK1-like [Coccinella septempunctata]
MPKTPKRVYDRNSDEPFIKKIDLTDCDRNGIELVPGEILKDLSGNEWILGKAIGCGGFGVIHEVSQKCKKEKNKYVVKIETHTNGPLFTEINCYLRIGKKEMIDEWTKQKSLPVLGMPHYVASGSHIFKGIKYRFLVLPRFEKDLEAIFEEKKKFNLKTVLLISSQILQVLEYIHEKGYIHSDIKAANIMLSQVKTLRTKNTSSDLSTYSKSPVADSKKRCLKLRNCKVRKVTQVLRPKRYDTRKVKCIDYNIDHLFDVCSLFGSEDEIEDPEEEEYKIKKIKVKEVKREQLYLLDFGLASKYRLSTGEHKNCEDERKAHAGTLLFCSRDAHKGIQSRRSDLESLAYNMVYWLTGSLPWIDDLENPEMMQRKKRHCFVDISGFLYFCMPDPPRILKEFFQYIKGLDIQDTPDYNACQQFIMKALKEHGYHDQKFDFDNVEGWGLNKKKVSEKVGHPVDVFKRPPLLSNMPVKPILRRKTKKTKTQAALKWSMMLSDPEVLLKKVNRKVETNDAPTVLDFDLEEMNPTPAMREVFKKYEERKGLSPNSYGETDLGDVPDGYTPAMAAVRQKVLELRELEEAVKVKPIKRNRKRTRKTSKKNNNKESSKSKQKSSLPTRIYSLRG